jgi:hypothetical protein
MVPSNDFIASMNLIGVAADGGEHVFVVGVEKPLQQATGEWACPTLAHDCPRPQPIYGEDSLQALCLGLSFIRLRLEAFLEGGGRLFLDEERVEISRDALAAWFSRIGSDRAG